jgi:hypothetical protein
MLYIVQHTWFFAYVYGLWSVNVTATYHTPHEAQKCHGNDVRMSKSKVSLLFDYCQYNRD